MWFFNNSLLVAQVRRLAYKMGGPPHAFHVSLISMESGMLVYSVTAGPAVDHGERSSLRDSRPPCGHDVVR
jgi:hypothetical protein